MTYRVGDIIDLRSHFLIKGTYRVSFVLNGAGRNRHERRRLAKAKR